MFDKETYIRYGGVTSPLENEVNYKNRPIFLFGCSFIEGAGLKAEDNIDYRLAKYLKSPVYNRSAGGWGTQHTLFQLKSDEFYTIFNDKKNPIIIYTYMNDHQNRINKAMEPILFGGYPTFVYHKKNNELIYDKFSEFIFRFPVLSTLKEIIYYNTSKAKDRAEFLKMHILESKKEIDKHYNGQRTDFILLIYEEDYEILSIIDDLIKNGVKVVSYEQITGLNSDNISLQISEIDAHPSKKAWEIFIPKFGEYIKNLENNQNNIIQYKEEKIKQYQITNYSFNICNIFRERPYAYFSISYKDNKLVEEKKLSQLRTKIAYTFWSIGNLVDGLHIKHLSNIFINISIKINPYNDFYKQYKKYNL